MTGRSTRQYAGSTTSAGQGAKPEPIPPPTMTALRQATYLARRSRGQPPGWEKAALAATASPTPTHHTHSGQRTARIPPPSFTTIASSAAAVAAMTDPNMVSDHL